MPGDFIDLNAPSLQGTLPKSPKDLPQGLIAPPQVVRDQLRAADDKLLKEHGFRLSQEAMVRELSYQTLNYFFDYLGYEVAYRETPDGPEVLAVGYEEILALTRGMSLEVQMKIRRWLP